MTNRRKYTVDIQPDDHRRMQVVLDTDEGQAIGTITGDPNMPPETMAALTTMMKLFYEAAIRGEIPEPTPTKTQP